MLECYSAKYLARNRWFSDAKPSGSSRGILGDVSRLFEILFSPISAALKFFSSPQPAKAAPLANRVDPLGIPKTDLVILKTDLQKLSQLIQMLENNEPYESINGAKEYNDLINSLPTEMQKIFIQEKINKRDDLEIFESMFESIKDKEIMQKFDNLMGLIRSNH